MHLYETNHYKFGLFYLQIHHIHNEKDACRPDSHPVSEPNVRTLLYQTNFKLSLDLARSHEQLKLVRLILLISTYIIKSSFIDSHVYNMLDPELACVLLNRELVFHFLPFLLQNLVHFPLY